MIIHTIIAILLSIFAIFLSMIVFGGNRVGFILAEATIISLASNYLITKYFYSEKEK